MLRERKKLTYPLRDQLLQPRCSHAHICPHRVDLGQMTTGVLEASDQGIVFRSTWDPNRVFV